MTEINKQPPLATGASEISCSTEQDNNSISGCDDQSLHANMPPSPVSRPEPALPALAPSNFDAIPGYLKERRQWLVWRLEDTGRKKPTKVPHKVNGQKAKTNDPSTWTDFETCQKALASGGFDGVGFAFADGDGLSGIDLDHCIGVDGQIEQWAREIVDQFEITYAETSPSGDGLHIWCLGAPIKTGSKKWKRPGTEVEQGVEVYDHTSPRYLTVTGQVLKNPNLVECQSGLDWLHERYFAETKPEPQQVRKSDGQIDADLVQDALQHISADERSTWIQIGMALKTGGLEFAIWETWSAKSSKYVPGECARKWSGFTGTRVTLGTVFFLAQQNGFVFPKQPALNRDSELETSTAPPDWTNPDTFGEPILFGEIEAPEIASDFLPQWVRDFVDAVAEQTQTPVGMAAMLVLAVLAACLQKRFEVSPHGDGYTEPLSLWVLVAMPPASRKTAVLQALTEPISEWEREQELELAPAIAERETRRDVSIRRIDELTRRASKEEY